MSDRNLIRTCRELDAQLTKALRELEEQSRLRQLAVEQMDMWKGQWTELNVMYAALFGAVERARAELERTESALARPYNFPVTTAIETGIPIGPKLSPPLELPIWSDEQFAKIKVEWEGFAHPTGRHPEGGCPCVDAEPPDPSCPFHGDNPRKQAGQPECTTCERRVQQGEQPPFPTVQAKQWTNHGGRVWTRLCEPCRRLHETP